MNRRQRRAVARGQRISGPMFIGDPETIAHLDVHCPDCASEVRYWTDTFGITRADIHHDETCPIWQEIQRTEDGKTRA